MRKEIELAGIIPSFRSKETRKVSARDGSLELGSDEKSQVDGIQNRSTTTLCTSAVNYIASFNRATPKSDLCLASLFLYYNPGSSSVTRNTSKRSEPGSGEWRLTVSKHDSAEGGYNHVWENASGLKMGERASARPAKSRRSEPEGVRAQEGEPW
jgi:hypothetical protein